jgi:crotonobetainyl-CoA:carnitine CoA-transferase CaiB-like acyl-CoA transferase
LTSPAQALHDLWRLAGLPQDALGFAHLTGADPVLASSFAVGTAAQASIAAAALAACELGHARGVPRQQVSVDMVHAALECVGPFTVNGVAPEIWDKFSGLYACADGWVRVHANFKHHREGALRLLGLDTATAMREDAERAMASWRALDFETAAADAGMVATALRSFEQWDGTGQGQAIARQPLLAIERIGDAPPLALAPLAPDQRPLEGVRALDLTRILAGPVGGRALAAYGADVMLVNSPHLPNIEAIADTSRGKLSTHIDLRTDAGRGALENLLGQAHVFVQGYRPGGLAALGFGPQEAARRRPGLVYVSLSAYGAQGPWAARRGFDSLVQTATGFNHAEGEAAGEGKPRPLPMQLLDHATGYLIAMGASAALWRQQREGGSWHVQVSLAQTAHWLRGLGRIENGFGIKRPDPKVYLQKSPSGFGELMAMRHSAQLSRTPAQWTRPAVPPGTHAPVWP